MHVKLPLFSYPSILTCDLGAQKNLLIETFFEYSQHILRLRNEKNNFTGRTLIWRSDIDKLFGSNSRRKNPKNENQYFICLKKKMVNLRFLFFDVFNSNINILNVLSRKNNRYYKTTLL